VKNQDDIDSVLVIQRAGKMPGILHEKMMRWKTGIDEII
jgi:hypothetical protein